MEIRRAPGEPFVYEQRPITGRPVLIPAEQARDIVERFAAAYPGMGNPRLVIHVNRDLVDEQSGVKLTGRTERTETTTRNSLTKNEGDPRGGIAAKTNSVPARREIAGSQTRVSAENRYRVQDKPEAPLADRQTIRDVERLFARPFREAGVRFADQRVAAQLSAPASTGVGESSVAERDRAALKQVADVAVEILISSREVTVPEIAGDRIYSVPDIHATATRLSDAQILGQAASSDVIGAGHYAGWAARNFDVREITEATALVLMDEILRVGK